MTKLSDTRCVRDVKDRIVRKMPSFSKDNIYLYSGVKFLHDDDTLADFDGEAIVCGYIENPQSQTASKKFKFQSEDSTVGFVVHGGRKQFEPEPMPEGVERTVNIKEENFLKWGYVFTVVKSEDVGDAEGHKIYRGKIYQIPKVNKAKIILKSGGVVCVSHENKNGERVEDVLQEKGTNTFFENEMGQGWKPSKLELNVDNKVSGGTEVFLLSGTHTSFTETQLREGSQRVKLQPSKRLARANPMGNNLFMFGISHGRTEDDRGNRGKANR